jgi:hypothetical protein
MAAFMRPKQATAASIRSKRTQFTHTIRSKEVRLCKSSHFEEQRENDSVKFQASQGASLNMCILVSYIRHSQVHLSSDVDITFNPLEAAKMLKYLVSTSPCLKPYQPASRDYKLNN